MPVAGGASIALAALLYLAVVLGIGVWAARRTRTTRDYFIAGQGVGLLVTAMATMSAAFSGFVFLGGPGLTYRIGVSALWIVLPVGVTGGLLCWVLARKLRLLSGIREIYTVPDAIAARFDSRWATGLSAVAVVAGTVAYLGAQLLALGVLLQSIAGLRSFGLALAVGVMVLLAYSVIGGMVAGVYTSLVQGGLMVSVAGAVFVLAIRAAGGWREMTASIAGSEAFGPRFLEPLGGTTALAGFGLFFVFGVGVLGQPQMLHKFYMLDDPRKLKWMPFVLGTSQALCLLIWIGIGLAVPALVAQGELTALVRPDDATPMFLMHQTGRVFAGLVFAGLLAAIMSTADSFVNIGSAALVRDLPRALGRPLRRELTWARVAAVAIGAASALLAYGYGDLIALLGTFAFGTFGAALAPALAVGFCWKGVTARAASASIATGLVLTPLLELLDKQTLLPWLPPSPLAPGVPPAAASLAASFAVLFLVSGWRGSRRADPLAPDVRQVMES